MITPKARIGFILLALIVFPTAYFSWVPPMPAIPTSNVDLGEYQINDKSIHETQLYTTQDISFDAPWKMAMVATAIMELFTLVCYLVLKRVEPYIVALEKSERERIQKRNSL